MSDSPTVISRVFALKDEYNALQETIDPEGPDKDKIDVMVLSDLMRIRKDLSCLSLDLAKSTAKYGRSFKTDKAKYDAQRYGEQRRLMNKDVKVTAAEAQAKQYVADQLEGIAINEGLRDTGKLILNQVNEILKSLNQDISIIKKEYESIANQ